MRVCVCFKIKYLLTKLVVTPHLDPLHAAWINLLYYISRCLNINVSLFEREREERREEVDDWGQSAAWSTKISAAGLKN